jgi:hypothetical protein
MTDATPDATATPADPPRPRFGAARIAVTIVLGLLGAWFLFDGISNLLAFPQQLEAFGIAERTPWLILWASVVAPPVIFAVAALIGRRQPVTRYTLVLIVALCVMATTRLSLIAAAGASVSLA